jgi:hypothetical protein
VTERLPRPATARFPTLQPVHIRELPVGTQLARIYRVRGDHPTAWNEFRAYGPLKYRFDHHPLPRGSHRFRSIMYVAAEGAMPTGIRRSSLRTCLAEVFRPGPIALSRDSPYFALFDIVRTLRLLDLADSSWVTQAGGNGAICSGLRSTARDWSRAIYRHYPDLDGLYYLCSHDSSARSVALYERAHDALPTAPTFNRALGDPALRAAVETYATELKLDLLA